MDINNIALVRATNVIPFDGIVKPLSNVPYLCKNTGLSFSSKMSSLLRELRIIPPMDQTRVFEDGYFENMAILSSKILKEYLPYVSDYNSMVLFSLNGICPDDNEHGFANNIFSNKKVAIIEPLSCHINETISLVPTDTAIKGDVVLSSEAIVLIEDNLYDSLSDEEKLIISNNNFTIKLFAGSLKDAIREALQNSGKYIPEVLSLSASTTGGIMPSETSEMQKECINSIAEAYGIPQIKFFDLITSRDSTMPKYDEVCDEFNNGLIVQDYFMVMFLEELLVFLNASKDMIDNVSKNIDNEFFLLKIIDLIKENGIENYKRFLDDYNARLKEKQKDMTLITPQEIVFNKIRQKK